MNRRDLFVAGAAGVVLAKTSGAFAAPAKATLKPGKHDPVPLPFKAGALTGISDKMITSHHDKNYAGAVKNLNKVEVDIAALKSDAPGYHVAGLREKELTYFNSMVLHEHYFGNLGGNGKRSGALESRLSSELGAWDGVFKATAAGLGGGSGWVVVAFNLTDGGVRIAQSTNHTQAMAAGIPLLVMDMYEHAYAIDYGADHAQYIEAFFKNLAWDAVEGRYEKALKAAAAFA